MLKFYGLKFFSLVLVWRKVDKDGEPYKGLGKITRHNYEYLALATKGDFNEHVRDQLDIG